MASSFTAKHEFCLILHELLTQVRQDCDLEPLVLPEPVARYISEARELRAQHLSLASNSSASQANQQSLKGWSDTPDSALSKHQDS